MKKQNSSSLKTDAQWKKILTPDQYAILREKETEAPFSGKYVHTRDKGMYVCAACGTPLFPSETKFDSGTGWLAENKNIELRKDTSHGMDRTEVLCAHCGGHLGHLFMDGPTTAGKKRYCINSTCLLLKKEVKP